MKNQVMATMAGVLMLGLAGKAQADLVLAGTVDFGPYQGAKVINDTDLNITWLDYIIEPDTWQGQKDWAGSLSLTVNGKTYSGWRLPDTVDDLGRETYDGSTSKGYNNTTSEMGHLYYTELGNISAYDMNGNQNDYYGLNGNTGLFYNLINEWLWSGTSHDYGPSEAWIFHMGQGYQTYYGQDERRNAIAVRPGQIQAVPEPASVLLVGVGLAGLVGLRRKWCGH